MLNDANERWNEMENVMKRKRRKWNWKDLRKKKSFVLCEPINSIVVGPGPLIHRFISYVDDE